jgi:hypothetical protein
VTANEDSYRIGGNSQQSKCLSAMARRGEMSWPTPQTSDIYNAANAERPTHRPQLRDVQKNFGLVVPATPSSDGSRPASWATPEAKNQVGYQVGQDGTKWPKLGSQAQAWATPRNMTGGTCRNGIEHSDLNSQAGGKLNPRWVETLMGLPVGWTMPGCASPVIPESTSSASSETASCPQSPSEPSASS